MRAGAVITGTPLDPLVAFAELGRMKLGEGDLRAVLGRVAELARQTLPGVVGASVTLVESDRAFTAAFAGQLALDLDETQYQEGFGPCLDVAQQHCTPERAFEILTRLSQSAHRKLRDCAADLVTSTAEGHRG
jgi:hypothetical protein